MILMHPASTFEEKTSFWNLQILQVSKPVPPSFPDYIKNFLRELPH